MLHLLIHHPLLVGMYLLTCFSFLHSAVPAKPISSVCAVYDMGNTMLEIIETTWDEVVCCTCEDCLYIYPVITDGV